VVKQDNPLDNLFPQIEKILNFIVVKNSREAEKYETSEMAKEASLFYQALIQQDNYLLYSDRYTEQMFVEVDPTLRREFIAHWLENPYNVPERYREFLLERGREHVLGPAYALMRSDPSGDRDYHQLILDHYKRNVERNDYYRMLTGMPPIDATESDYVHVPLHVRERMHTTRTVEDLPVHMLEGNDQDILMGDPWFEEECLPKNQDKPYLLYLGKRGIDPMLARQARDFQLIRYIPMENAIDINPYLLKDFSGIYNEYRDYVMLTLYNREFEDLYENYRPFMAVLITMYVILQLCNRAVEHTTDFHFLDDKVIAIIFQMYGIPSDLIVTMTHEVQRKLATSLAKLIRSKATNGVFYDLIRILGFDNVTVSKLMLMKQQRYDDDGQAYFSDGTKLSTFEDMDQLYLRDDHGDPVKELAIHGDLPDDDWEVDDDHPLRGLPHFQAIDLKDGNPYRTIVNDETSSFDYHEITGADPRWWDLPDTRDLIRNRNYTNADSKYIMVESLIRDTSYLYEVVYFMRMIIDNQVKTDQFMMLVPELLGSVPVSMFDLMIFVLAATCENYGLEGIILTSASGLLSIAGFNFDIDLTKFREFLEKTKYADQERIMSFMSNITVSTPSSLKFIFEEVLIPFKDWLTYEMSTCLDRQRYLEYEKVFRSTYSYDIAQQVFVHDFKPPMEKIGSDLHIPMEDISMLRLFYPHHPDGTTITVDDEDNPYDPFLGESIGLRKEWYVSTGRGDDKLYFHDILNSPDLRYVQTDDGRRLPNPIFWDQDKNSYDMEAVSVVINSIRSLSPTQLSNAYFRVNTLNPDTGKLIPGIQRDSDGNVTLIQYLPDSIRAEGVLRDILTEKVTRDMRGEADPPNTYLAYLKRRNPLLYDLFGHDKKGTKNTEWMNALMIVVMAIESEVNLRLKTWEHAVVGTDMFFRSLITMIRYFKSYMIDFARCGIRYVFDSKIDPGGGSNMMRLFDEIWEVGWHTELSEIVGLYDTNHLTRHHWVLSDRGSLIEDYLKPPTEDEVESLPKRRVHRRNRYHGSLRLVDEAKFYLNGTEEESSESTVTSFWRSGELNVGRYDMEHDHTTATKNRKQRNISAVVDTDAWVEFVELPPE